MTNTEVVLINLLRYIPVEGSIGSHDVWKETVLIVGKGVLCELVRVELSKSGYISMNCRRLLVGELRRLTSLEG